MNTDNQPEPPPMTFEQAMNNLERRKQEHALIEQSNPQIYTPSCKTCFDTQYIVSFLPPQNATDREMPVLQHCPSCASKVQQTNPHKHPVAAMPASEELPDVLLLSEVRNLPRPWAQQAHRFAPGDRAKFERLEREKEMLKQALAGTLGYFAGTSCSLNGAWVYGKDYPTALAAIEAALQADTETQGEGEAGR